MFTSILQKCLAELVKETPDISYVRGMLETLIEIEPKEPSIKSWSQVQEINVDNVYKSSYPTLMANDPTPEGQAVDMALASLQGMPKPKLDSLTIEKNIIL